MGWGLLKQWGCQLTSFFRNPLPTSDRKTMTVSTVPYALLVSMLIAVVSLTDIMLKMLMATMMPIELGS